MEERGGIGERVGVVGGNLRRGFFYWGLFVIMVWVEVAIVLKEGVFMWLVRYEVWKSERWRGFVGLMYIWGGG